MNPSPFLFIDDEAFDFSRFDNPYERTRQPKFQMDQVLLEMIGKEAGDIAGCVAASASVANAAPYHHEPQISLRSIVRYLPLEPRIFTQVAGQMLTGDTEPALVSAIQHYYTQLRAVCEVTRATVEAREMTSAQLRFISDAWQDLCNATIETADEINAHLPADATGNAQNILKRCLTQLTRAAAGELPCVKPGGVIEVPGLVERRRSPRYPVCWHAEALVDGREIAVVVEDLSRHGLGAVTSRPLARGLGIEVRVGGRSLHGKIMWTRGEHFGVLLSTPFIDGDDLLLAAQTETRQ